MFLGWSKVLNINRSFKHQSIALNISRLCYYSNCYCWHQTIALNVNCQCCNQLISLYIPITFASINYFLLILTWTHFPPFWALFETVRQILLILSSNQKNPYIAEFTGAQDGVVYKLKRTLRGTVVLPGSSRFYFAAMSSVWGNSGYWFCFAFCEQIWMYGYEWSSFFPSSSKFMCKGFWSWQR